MAGIFSNKKAKPNICLALPFYFPFKNNFPFRLPILTSGIPSGLLYLFHSLFPILSNSSLILNFMEVMKP